MSIEDFPQRERPGTESRTLTLRAFSAITTPKGLMLVLLVAMLVVAGWALGFATLVTARVLSLADTHAEVIRYHQRSICPELAEMREEIEKLKEVDRGRASSPTASHANEGAWSKALDGVDD